MTLLGSIEECFPEFFDRVMADCGIKIATRRPEHRIPLILSASFDRRGFLYPGIRTAVSAYNIAPTDKLFAVTARKLAKVLAATRFVGKIHIPIYVDVISGLVSAGRFSVQAQEAVDREQPIVYGGSDDDYQMLLGLNLITRR